MALGGNQLIRRSCRPSKRETCCNRLTLTFTWRPGGRGCGGGGATLDDVAAEGEPVDDFGAEPGSVNVLVHQLELVGDNEEDVRPRVPTRMFVIPPIMP